MNNVNKLLLIFISICFFFSVAYSENQSLNGNYQVAFKIPANTNISNIRISFAPLKYNKRFAYGVTSDDLRIGTWSQIFQYFRGGWIDNEPSFHYNMKRSTGGYAPRALTYTDGCGVERIFAVNSANWYNLREGYWSYPMDKKNPTRNWPFVVWEEQEIINDFDGSCSFHDVQNPDLPVGVYGGGNIQNSDEIINNIIKGYVDANDKHIKPRMNRGIMVLTEPNGDSYYTLAAEKTSFIRMITRQENNEFSFVNLSDPTLNFNKFKLGRYFNDAGTFESHQSKFYNDIVSKSINGVHMYGEFGLHALTYKGNDIITSTTISESPKIRLFDWLCNTYGSGRVVDPQTGLITKGSDELWFATNDEVYQYKYLSRDNITKINYVVDRDSLKISLSIPSIEDFYWTEYTLLIDGIDANDVFQIKTDESIVGVSYGNTKDDKASDVMMLNLNYDKTLLTRADKYISLTQSYFDNEGNSDVTEEYKRYANYFIQRLKPELQKIYKNKLDRIFDSPILTSVDIESVNNGTTHNPRISLTFSYDGNPKEYRISKDPDINKVGWSQISDNVECLLSENESTRVYLQLRNEYGISNVDSTTVIYYDPSLILYNIKLASNMSYTEESNIIFKLDIGGAPTHYMLSEDSTFATDHWIPYAADLVSYQLSSNSGMKTVYAKLKNDVAETATVSCQIDYVTSTYAILSFAGDRAWNQITYPLTKDSLMINLVQFTIYDTYTSKKFKSRTGRDLDWYLELNSQYYLSNNECSMQGTNFSDGAYFQPILEGNQGVYEDIYIKKALALNANGSINQKGRLVFTLPQGEYRFKLLMSVSSNIGMNANQVNTSWYRVDANGKTGVPVNPGNHEFTGVNNTSFNAEINNVIVDEYSEGNVVLYIYTEGLYNAHPAINLIEIIKIK